MLGGELCRFLGLLIWLPFKIRDGVLKTGPLLRLERHKFDPEVMITAPPDHRLLYLYRRLVLGSMYAKLQCRAGMDLGQAGDPAPAQRHIQDMAVSIDKIDRSE
jgi:hypothetical protein